MPPRTCVFTDGACLGNPGPGGWAWAVPGGRWASGAEGMTTNQRMELRAALEAVRSLDGPLEIVSDSTYVVNCFRDRWWEGWLARGWQNKARKPVANRDLWEPLVDAYRAEPGRLVFRWVKGHSKDPMNDLVDRLAVEAARSREGRSGEGTPTDLGPADVAGAAGTPSVDPRVPAGRLVAVGGQRGWEPGLFSSGGASKLGEILAAKRDLHPDLVVLTGLGLGAEQLGAEVARHEGVPYVAVLPFPGQEAKWPPDAQRRFHDLLAGARDVVLLQAKVPDGPQQFRGAFARRDGWLARHAHKAVLVWDGADEATGRLVRSFQDHLGEEEVWVVQP